MHCLLDDPWLDMTMMIVVKRERRPDTNCGCTNSDLLPTINSAVQVYTFTKKTYRYRFAKIEVLILVKNKRRCVGVTA